MTPLDDATAFFIDAIERPTAARVVPFEPWHLPLLVQREHEASSFAALGGTDRTARLCDDAEYAYTVLATGSAPVACIGVSVMWSGVGAAWAFLSADAPRYWKTIHSGVTTFLRGALCDGEFRRIQTSVRSDHAAGHRWALRLGFRPESVMHGYCPDGTDAICYVRLAHDRR